MKSPFFAMCFLAPIFLFAQEYSYRTIEFDVQDENYINSFTYKNLRLYPIKAKATLKEQTKQITRYTPLKKALETKKIQITEKDDRQGAEVNTLYVLNTSSDTV